MKTTIAMLICCAAMGQEKRIDHVYLDSVKIDPLATHPNFLIFSKGGDAIVTFKPDGEIVIAKGMKTDDAARSFIDAVHRLNWLPCPVAK